jgi:hypothetical protein
MDILCARCKVKVSPASALIQVFGNHHKLFHALKGCGYSRSLVSIYRWTYSKAKGGTGGRIPRDATMPIIIAAAAARVRLPAEVFGGDGGLVVTADMLKKSVDEEAQTGNAIFENAEDIFT